MITEKELNNLENLISSKDAKTQYLAACLIRTNKKLDNPSKLMAKIPVNSRINTISELLRDLGESIDILPYKEPKNALESYINACILIPKIVKYYNEGWVPDFTKSDNKYFPYFRKKGPVWSVSDGVNWSGVSSDLPASHYYKNREVLMEACKKFESIYNDWLNYI